VSTETATIDTSEDVLVWDGSQPTMPDDVYPIGSSGCAPKRPSLEYPATLESAVLFAYQTTPSLFDENWCGIGYSVIDYKDYEAEVAVIATNNDPIIYNVDVMNPNISRTVTIHLHYEPEDERWFSDVKLSSYKDGVGVQVYRIWKPQENGFYAGQF
jgi:hypothetical protein